MMVEYPYTEKDEIYLYTMNYSITYKSNEENLCYKGLNESTLQLVKVNTNDAGSKYEGFSSVSGTNIKSYMEDGSLCYDPITNKSCNTKACPTKRKCYRTPGECLSVTGHSYPKYRGNGNGKYAEGYVWCTS